MEEEGEAPFDHRSEASFASLSIPGLGDGVEELGDVSFGVVSARPRAALS